MIGGTRIWIDVASAVQFLTALVPCSSTIGSWEPPNMLSAVNRLGTR